MKFGSVCSGIEAASVAWDPLGWWAEWFSEIEPFPSAVLAQQWPGIPNLGDMKKLHERKEFRDESIDLLIGGTPCQSFSVAGLREGLADPRGNLALHFLKILDQKRPRWVVWENVPGVLSSTSEEGHWELRDFSVFLAGLRDIGYGWAYRVLDAQYFGLAQRRQRVFVVGYLGDWRPAAAVLFERQSLSGHPAPSRTPGKGIAPTIASRPTGGGGLGTDFDLDGGLVAKSLMGKRNDSCDPTLQTYVTGCLGSGGKTAGSATMQDAYSDLLVAGTIPASGAGTERPAGQGNELDILVLDDQGGNQMSVSSDGKVGAMRSHQHQHQPIVAIPINTQIATRSNKLGEGTGLGIGKETDPAFTLQNAHSHAVQAGMAVRRLTPRECERLQGFPDDYTLIKYRGKPAADGPRYKALGNSMAVPVVRWIGKRIEQVDQILQKSY